MGTFLEIVKEVAWSSVRWFYCILRFCVWTLTGVEGKLRASRAKGAYKGTAHVRKILLTYAFDPLLTKPCEHQFITVHESFRDPEYVLQDHVTLLNVTDKGAFFVETATTDDVTRSDVDSHFVGAQYKLARKLIILPLEVFHKLSDKLPKPNVIALLNVARCGSSLTTQYFEELSNMITFNEPMALNTHVHYDYRMEKDKLVKILRNALKVICKPVHGRTIDWYVVKPRVFLNLLYWNELQDACAEVRTLYLYRNGMPASMSQARVIGVLPSLECLYYINRINLALYKLVFFYWTEVSADSATEKLASRLEFSAEVWAVGIASYFMLRNNGIAMKAAKYEDIMKDPSKELNVICQYLGVPFIPDVLEAVMKRDSQRASILSRRNTEKFKVLKVTEEQVKNINKRYRKAGVMYRIDEDVRLPDTITGSS